MKNIKPLSKIVMPFKKMKTLPLLGEKLCCVKVSPNTL
jgi:hypothetical protein